MIVVVDVVPAVVEVLNDYLVDKWPHQYESAQKYC
jgi:hypothetical protein